MDAARQIYDEQEALWNGIAGRAWVDQQALLDRTFKRLEDLLTEAVAARPGGRVLDVGCGTGSTTLAAARALGGRGTCVGLDISEPMLTAARARAEQDGVEASFILADAQTYAFEPASFDMIISRFGVMFFKDSVAAFGNLRRALTSEGELRFIAWRSPAENPFMTTAERAAAPLLPNIPARNPNGPGQFAFADQNRIRKILEESGWRAIDIQPVDVPCSFPAKELPQYLTRLGPLGIILSEADDELRTRVIQTVRSAFDPFVNGENVCFTAACWMVCARASAGAASQQETRDA